MIQSTLIGQSRIGSHRRIRPRNMAAYWEVESTELEAIMHGDGLRIAYEEMGIFTSAQGM